MEHAEQSKSDKADKDVRIILFTSTKGGTGKTTIATNIAAMRTLSGHSTMGLDLDDQKSALDWAGARNADGVVTPVRFQPLRLAENAPTLRQQARQTIWQIAQQFDTLILDAGGADNPGLRVALSIATDIIIPTSPAQFDIWTIRTLKEIYFSIVQNLDYIPCKPKILCSRASPLTREAEETKALLSEAYEGTFDIIPHVVHDRAIYRRSLADGRCIYDTPGTSISDSAARLELSLVYREIFGEDFIIARQTKEPAHV